MAFEWDNIDLFSASSISHHGPTSVTCTGSLFVPCQDEPPKQLGFRSPTNIPGLPITLGETGKLNEDSIFLEQEDISTDMENLVGKIIDTMLIESLTTNERRPGLISIAKLKKNRYNYN